MGVYFRSIAAALASFLGGVLLDADHFFDYYLNNGFTFKIREIYSGCCNAAGLQRLYLILHAYEFVVIFWIAILIIPLGNIWIALAIGITQHMFIDTITNPLNALGYLITYRIKKGFKKEYILRNAVKET